MFFLISVSSKSKKTLNYFLSFLSNIDSKNSNLFIKYFPKQKTKKVITVLKSPHVHKKAQEQFEFRVCTKKLFINSLQHLKFLYFLKKVQNNIFPFISLKIEGCFYVKNKTNFIFIKMDPNKLNINFLNPDSSIYQEKNKSKLFIQYLNLLDCNGEYYLKQLN